MEIGRRPLLFLLLVFLVGGAALAVVADARFLPSGPQHQRQVTTAEGVATTADSYRRFGGHQRDRPDHDKWKNKDDKDKDDKDDHDDDDKKKEEGGDHRARYHCDFCLRVVEKASNALVPVSSSLCDDPALGKEQSFCYRFVRRFGATLTDAMAAGETNVCSKITTWDQRPVCPPSSGGGVDDATATIVSADAPDNKEAGENEGDNGASSYYAAFMRLKYLMDVVNFFVSKESPDVTVKAEAIVIGDENGDVLVEAVRITTIQGDQPSGQFSGHHSPFTNPGGYMPGHHVAGSYSRPKVPSSADEEDQTATAADVQTHTHEGVFCFSQHDFYFALLRIIQIALVLFFVVETVRLCTYLCHRKRRSCNHDDDDEESDSGKEKKDPAVAPAGKVYIVQVPDMKQAPIAPRHDVVLTSKSTAV